MRIAEQTVSQVKQYQDIVSFIGEYVSLRRRGRNYIGLCPFHSEKTPSFNVSPERHMFHCFGCHESGDLISFVQKIENLSFAESIVFIAEKIGVEVIQDTSSSTYDPEAENRRRIRDVLYAFRESCRSFLTEDTQILEYVKKRGIDEKRCQDFHLGFCPSSYNLIDDLKEKGFAPEDGLKAGILFKSEQGNLVSRFRGRLMFPVVDYQGRTLGFGGRVVSDDQKGAKYVNSEETSVFNKRSLLYGLYQAKKGIKDKGLAILVEGYMDVIMCHQFGFTNTVASMGTALTAEQAQKLKRFTDVVYLAMDSDEAGQTAMMRSYEVLTQYGVTAYFVQLDSKDPADLLLSSGADVFQTAIDSALPVIEFRFLRLLQQYDVSKIEQVTKIVDEIVPFIQREGDMIVRRHYVQKFSQKLGIDSELVMAKISKKSYNSPKRIFQHDKNKKTKIQIAEESLISYSAIDVDVRHSIFDQITPQDFSDPVLRQIAEEIKSSTHCGTELIQQVRDEKFQQLLSQIMMTDEYQLDKAQYVTQVMACVEVVKGQKRSLKAEEIKQKIRELEQAGEHEKISDLLRELQNLKTVRGK